MKYCANCGAQVENEAVICPYCGSKQTEGAAQASASQTQTKFCTNCGAQIHAEAVVRRNELAAADHGVAGRR